MPSVRYYNQTAPFWDFVASMENGQGFDHSSRNNNARSDAESDNEQHQQPWGGWPFGRMPHRGGRHHRGPPPPDGNGPPPPPPVDGQEPEGESSEQRGPPHGHRGRHGGPHGRGFRGPPPPAPAEEGQEQEAGPFEARGPFGHHGRRGRGPRGGPPHHRGPPPFGGPFGDFIRSQMFGEEGTREKNDDFKPEADVFDTPESFVLHIALPGAKKEDIGVSWDAEKSELSVAGVIYRPGDEDFLKTLALDERRVGAFEKKVRLGSRASPAQIDSDAITAKLEDGVLLIDVPKLDAGYVEIKKVDIE